VTSGTLEVRIASDDLRVLGEKAQRGTRLAVCLTIGATLALCAVLLQVFDAQSMRIGGIGVAAIATAVVSAIAFVAALRSR
jgi:hypothetical protein